MIDPTYSGQRVTVMLKGSFDRENARVIEAAARAAAVAEPAPYASVKVDEVHAAFWRRLIAQGRFNEWACPPFIVPSPLPEDDP